MDEQFNQPKDASDPAIDLTKIGEIEQLPQQESNSPVVPSAPENLPPQPPPLNPENLSPVTSGPPVFSAPPPPPPPPNQTFLAEEEGGLGGLKKLWPIPLVVLIIVLLGFLFIKFNPFFGGTYTSKSATLTYWGLWEEDNVLAGIIADYEKNHPSIKINYVRQSATDYREHLQSFLAQGKGPDIFRFHNTWVPMLKNELSPVPATVFDASTFSSTFYPTANNDLKSGGVYLGVPLEIDGLAFFVNDDLLKAAGKTAPTTWDDLRKLALALRVPQDTSQPIQIAGVALGRTENVDHWSDILALMMLQNGVDLNNPQGNLAEDALTYFTLFSSVDHVWDETLPSSTTAFANGKVAMYFGPSWKIFEIKKINPNLNFKVLPVPQLPGSNVTWASYWAEGVAKRSKNQAAAWDFLKYLSSKETMQKLYQASSQTRLFGEPYSRVELGALVKSDPYVGAYIQEAPNAKSWYLASQTFDNGINDKMIKYFGDAVNAVNQGKTAKEALETVSKGVAQVLAQYGLSSPVIR